jgi:hypothetical protein
MSSRTVIQLLLFLAAGCTSGAGGTDDEQLRNVLVPGYKTPSSILYSRGDSETCRAISKRSTEVSDSFAKWEPFLEGYSQVRVKSVPEAYRAFFKPDRMAAAPYESAFIFCTNDSTPISVACRVIGTMPSGCFETGYNWYKLSEIDSLIRAMHTNAPAWRPRGGT